MRGGVDGVLEVSPAGEVDRALNSKSVCLAGQSPPLGSAMRGGSYNPNSIRETGSLR